MEKNNISVVHISTAVGKSSACVRLHMAERKYGMDSCVLTGYMDGDIIGAYRINNIQKKDILSRIKNKIDNKVGSIKESIFESKYKIVDGMPFTKDLSGRNILKRKEVINLIKNSDVIHLHWICGFISIKEISQLKKFKKPIVWTFHDIWPLTGGCHCDYNCEKYKCMICGKCPIINSTKDKDISTVIVKKKKKYIRHTDLSIIAPSKWMEQNITQNVIFYDKKCFNIPNALDTNIFSEKSLNIIVNKYKIKKDNSKINLLFSSSSLNTPYKGICYLYEMLRILKNNHKDIVEKLTIHLLGSDTEDVYKELKGFEIKLWGRISDQEEIAGIYSLADCLVYPSLCDNLPNTVMEALSCETPVVAFDIGGISDLIDHKVNGYLSEPKNAKSLLEGILWILENNENNILGKNGREKVLNNFSEGIIARMHYNLYKELLENA